MQSFCRSIPAPVNWIIDVTYEPTAVIGTSDYKIQYYKLQLTSLWHPSKEIYQPHFETVGWRYMEQMYDGQAFFKKMQRPGLAICSFLLEEMEWPERLVLT